MTEPSVTPDLKRNPYHTAKLYVIRSPHTEKVYIGATTTTLGDRMVVHRSRHKRNTMQCRAKEIFDCGDAYIELVKEVHCDTRAELAQEEAAVLAAHPTAVNKNKPGRSRAQWLEDNREKQRAYCKAYKAAKKATNTPAQAPVEPIVKEFMRIDTWLADAVAAENRETQ